MSDKYVLFKLQFVSSYLIGLLKSRPKSSPLTSRLIGYGTDALFTYSWSDCSPEMHVTCKKSDSGLFP